ncbi:hypothetical protein PoMZ_06513, partial [Pyricularia oryzae]
MRQLFIRTTATDPRNLKGWPGMYSTPYRHLRGTQHPEHCFEISPVISVYRTVPITYLNYFCLLFGEMLVEIFWCPRYSALPPLWPDRLMYHSGASIVTQGLKPPEKTRHESIDLDTWWTKKLRHAISILLIISFVDLI